MISNHLTRIALAGLTVSACLSVASTVEAGCIREAKTGYSNYHCLKQECRGGFCVHVGTWNIRGVINSELTVHSRPANASHINLRCGNGKQIEGTFLRCGGEYVLAQACNRGGVFSKSKCSQWHRFSGY